MIDPKEERENLIWQAYNDLSPRDRELLKKYKKDQKDMMEWLKDN